MHLIFISFNYLMRLQTIVHVWCIGRHVFFLICRSLPTSIQSTSTVVVTPTPFTLPPIRPKSKCAMKARDFSADVACSGGTNIAEILTNRSAILDTARISRLHSHLCSSQSCFKKYVEAYKACFVDISGARGNATTKKLVRLCTFWVIMSAVIIYTVYRINVCLLL